MTKSTTLAAEAVRQREPGAAARPHPVPIRPTRGYLVAASTDAQDAPGLLLCDPLTGLVAYPSFEAHIIASLPALAAQGLHLAIGDVDDLRGYVTAAKADDPTRFGHLAGNDCMRRVGEATCRWAADVLDGWPFAVCATFGGDEVIVAASGRPYPAFLDALRDLMRRIRSTAPRPCSFASATVAPVPSLLGSAEGAYRRVVAHIDECLFRHKAVARQAGPGLGGTLVDLSILESFGHSD
jgi:GGDEF domain-containing protein